MDGCIVLVDNISLKCGLFIRVLFFSHLKLLLLSLVLLVVFRLLNFVFLRHLIWLVTFLMHLINLHMLFQRLSFALSRCRLADSFVYSLALSRLSCDSCDVWWCQCSLWFFIVWHIHALGMWLGDRCTTHKIHRSVQCAHDEYIYVYLCKFACLMTFLIPVMCLALRYVCGTI